MIICLGKEIGDIFSKFHEEWKKLSDDNVTSDHPWLPDYADFYDPYKVFYYLVFYNCYLL